MNRIVQQITKRLTANLPEDSQYYRLDELRSKGFPSFIVQRMQLQVARNLTESLVLPKTDWANIQSEAVQSSWQQFVEAIHSEAYLPAEFAKEVVETAVAEVLEILTQPRKSIPDIVFGAEDELDYQQVCERVKTVVVYRHFGQLIPGYMRKKSLNKLSKERCTLVIENADQKLTKNYSPLNWAQMLEPLFKLLNGEVDTNLLRLFFEDKKRLHIARRFDLMNDSLSRVQLIEELSSPDLLNFESYEEQQSGLFERLPHMQEKQKFEGPKDISDDDQPASEKGDDEEPLISEDEPDESEDIVNAEFQKPFSDETEEPRSINAVFAIDDTDENVEEDEEVSAPEEAKEDTPEQKNGTKATSNGDFETENEVSEGLNEETPMWKRFYEEEDADSINPFISNEGTEDSFTPFKENSKDGFIDEPLIDLANRPEPYKKERDELLKLLLVDRKTFISEIFGGSERAFDEAIEEIITFDSWRSASKYIEKEVFKRNHVNMYSEPAVNFTDRLQSYFLEKQNRN
ncbi:MAG TPA: hypothetical protein VF181_02340 [Balneolaceae bacterium]